MSWGWIPSKFHLLWLCSRRGLPAPGKHAKLRSKPSSSASGTCVLLRCSHQAERGRKTWDFQHLGELGAAGAKTLPRCKGCWPQQPVCPPAWHRCAAGRAEQHGKQILKHSRWYQLCINSLLQMVAAQELSPRCSEVPAMPQPGTSLSISPSPLVPRQELACRPFPGRIS